MLQRWQTARSTWQEITERYIPLACRVRPISAGRDAALSAFIKAFLRRNGENSTAVASFRTALHRGSQQDTFAE